MTSKWAPLSGIAFLVLVIGGGLYGGKPPSEQGLKSAEELAAAYAARGDKLAVAVFLMGVGLGWFVASSIGVGGEGRTPVPPLALVAPWVVVAGIAAP